MAGLMRVMADLMLVVKAINNGAVGLFAALALADHLL